LIPWSPFAALRLGVTSSRYFGATIPGMSVALADIIMPEDEPMPPPICDWVRGLLEVVGRGVGTTVVVGVPGAHWLVGQEFDVDEREQQVEPQPTAENIVKAATPAVSSSFFMFRFPVSCPPVASYPRFRT
jgi:hypothetical protein